MQWTIKLYERKRNPNMKSKPVMVGRRTVPMDAIPKKLAELKIKATSIDGAKAEARRQLKKRGHEVASMNFSADNLHTIIAHVFHGKQGKMRKA